MNKIAETAYLVAMYRALESERPDALFKDSWARLLAGSKGLILAEMLGAKEQAANVIAVRTHVMDQTIEKLIKEQQIDTVINLGAGLDTRPYRLSLPSSLKWIEVDFAEILAEKETHLKAQKPRCQLKRIKLDLADIELRRALFAEISAEATEVLVVSEGLLSYLPEDQVSLLSEDLRRQTNFRWWLFELISASGMENVPLQSREKLFHQYFSNSNNTSVFLFNPEQGLDFFKQRSWNIVEFYSVWKESRRLKRGIKFAALWAFFLPLFAKQYWQALTRQLGVTLLERGSNPN